MATLALPLLLTLTTLAEAQSGRFQYPNGPARGGTSIATKFGDFTDAGNGHLGIDFSGADGDVLVAAGDGVVTQSKDFGGAWGPVVIIRHEVGSRVYWSMYGHMGKRYVSIGDAVRRNQPIGTIGPKRPKSTADHLHFEVRIAGDVAGTDPGFAYWGKTFDGEQVTDKRNGITYYDPIRFLNSLLVTQETASTLPWVENPTLPSAVRVGSTVTIRGNAWDENDVSHVGVYLLLGGQQVATIFEGSPNGGGATGNRTAVMWRVGNYVTNRSDWQIKWVAWENSPERRAKAAFSMPFKITK